MTWSNDDDQETTLQVVTAGNKEDNSTVSSSKDCQVKTILCPSCGHTIEFQEQSTGLQNLPGLPAGVKFDPSDQEILEHLEAKVIGDERKLHPLIDEFIPTLEGENGICYTHPEKLPGVNKDGQVRHFFHRPSKAYTTGTRKRRKVHTDADGGETRWHKTGKTRPVTTNGSNIKGYKKILVLYTNYGRQRKPEKTNWVMHQYHLGDNEEEKDGELVVSKVFYQTQPRQCGSMNKEALSMINSNDSIIRIPSGVEIPFMKNAEGLVDYYSSNPSFMAGSYSIGGSQNVSHHGDGVSSQLMIPAANLVVRGDGSSFVHLPSNASKGE